MTKIADLLDLPREGQDRLWVVASNGAVIFRYPPLEVVHEETFDASEAVRQVLEQHPEALVAVEERGVGYRVNRPFPDGELSGDMIETELHEIIGEPVSRVIIRDPTASADDFVAMAARLGLHGTDYVVGWTAWLDLSPVGVSKASGLEYVARHLGLSAEDTLAIGDGRNDIEMLRWAGRGVAMGQAVQEVHDAADATAETVYDDGAAVELRRWFFHEPAGDGRLRAAAAAPDHPEDAQGMLAGRRRVSWHPDYPVRTTRTPPRWSRTATPTPRGDHDTSSAAATGSWSARSASSGPRRPGSRRACRDRGRLRAGRGGPRARCRDRGAHGPARAHRPGRRTRPGERARPRTAPACGCSPSAASPSCAARPRTASW